MSDIKCKRSRCANMPTLSAKIAVPIQEQPDNVAPEFPINGFFCQSCFDKANVGEWLPNGGLARSKVRSAFKQFNFGKPDFKRAHLVANHI